MLNAATIEATERKQKFARYKELLRRQDDLSSAEATEILALSKSLGRNLNNDSSVVSAAPSMTTDEHKGESLRKKAADALTQMNAAGPKRVAEMAEANGRYKAAVAASKAADAELGDWARTSSNVEQFLKDNADLLS